MEGEFLDARTPSPERRVSHIPNVPEEKANHQRYLEGFRVNACVLFKQHQCQQHRPFTCFNWHFQNQRRRRSVILPDGSFNYSPDIYCENYDDNTGICSNQDDCKLLHKVSGDVERKYHHRYFKTAQCVHPTDNRGHCVKNGDHCAFAHTPNDIRAASIGTSFPSDKETPAGYVQANRCFTVDDPLWNVEGRVLSYYKTELCRKPNRLCRQGYACPAYHNTKDRRRPPSVYKYRSTACPAAKDDEQQWQDPDSCEAADNCQYCHTRTEQQFHPEIYKSTKCSDMLENGFCPRAIFCAFAHHEDELLAPRNFHSNRRRSESPSPTPVRTPTRYDTPNSFPNGPPGLERRSEDFDVQFEDCDQRLRAQSINLGHLEMMKRQMMMANNDVPGFGAQSNGSIYRSQDSSGFNHGGYPSMPTLDEMENLRISEPSSVMMQFPFQPPSIESLQDRCHFLEDQLNQAKQAADMWRYRYETVCMEKNQLLGDRPELYRQLSEMQQMRQQMELPLAIRMPDNSYSIRPSASLPHSPSYNIFEVDCETSNPACARCGRDRSSSSDGSGPSSCPVCMN